MEAALKMQSLEWGKGRNSWMVTYQFKTDGFVRIESCPANLFVKALYTFISAQENDLKRDVFWVWINKPESKNSILHETTCCFPKVSVWKCQLEWTVRRQQGRHQSWCQCWQPLLKHLGAHSHSSKECFVPPCRFLQGARVLVGYRSAALLFLAVVEITLFSLSLEASIGEIREQKLKSAFNGNKIVWATEQCTHSSIGVFAPLPELESSASRREIANTPSVLQPLTQALCHLE